MRIVLISILFILAACTKPESCYNPELEYANRNTLCLQDCPQVCGCDGNTYCNACIASTHGISVDYDGPCK